MRLDTNETYTSTYSVNGDLPRAIHIAILNVLVPATIDVRVYRLQFDTMVDERHSIITYSKAIQAM